MRTLAIGGVDKTIAGAYYNTNPGILLFVPDLNRPGINSSVMSTLSARMTWHASPRNKFTFYYDTQRRDFPYPEAATTQPEAWAVEKMRFKDDFLLQTKWTSPLTNRLLLEASLSMPRLHSALGRMPGITDTQYSVTDLATGKIYGSGVGYVVLDYVMPMSRASLSYVTGSHSFKVGYTLLDVARFDQTFGPVVRQYPTTCPAS